MDSDRVSFDSSSLQSLPPSLSFSPQLPEYPQLDLCRWDTKLDYLILRTFHPILQCRCCGKRDCKTYEKRLLLSRESFRSKSYSHPSLVLLMPRNCHYHQEPNIHLEEEEVEKKRSSLLLCCCVVCCCEKLLILFLRWIGARRKFGSSADWVSGGWRMRYNCVYRDDGFWSAWLDSQVSIR